MLVVRQKRKHVHKTLREKAQALEKGLSNKEVAGKSFGQSFQDDN